MQGAFAATRVGKGPSSRGKGRRRRGQRLGEQDGADVVLRKCWGWGRPGLPRCSVLRAWGGVSGGWRGVLQPPALEGAPAGAAGGAPGLGAGASPEPGREQWGDGLQTLHSCASASLFDLEHLSWEVVSHF